MDAILADLKGVLFIKDDAKDLELALTALEESHPAYAKPW